MGDAVKEQKWVIYDAGNDFYFINTQKAAGNSPNIVPVFGVWERASRFATQEDAAKALLTLRSQHAEFVDCKVMPEDEEIA